MNTHTQTNICFNLRYLQLLPTAAFVVISALPGPALAFAEQAGWSSHAIVFLRDTKLSDTSLLRDFPNASTIPLAPNPPVVGQKIRLLATAYSSATGQTDSDPYTTASGTKVHFGTLAANFLPFGATIRLNDAIYIIEDRLNDRYDGRAIVDIWFPTAAAAFAFGVQVIEIEIISLP